MKNRCTVSVVLPTYNRAGIIHNSIKSVLNQTVKDYEIIIVDDCSTDNTLEVINRFNDKRIKYIRHKKRKGGSAARNTGIKCSNTEYIAFLDSDDEWFPTKLEKQINKFDYSSKDIGLLYTWLIHYGKDGNPLFTSKPNEKGNLLRKLLIKNIIGSASSVMVRKNVFASIGGFDESLPARQDMDLWVRISQNFLIDVVPEILAKISRQNKYERISSNKIKLLTAREQFYQKYKKLLRKENLTYFYLCNLGQFYREYFEDQKKLRSYFIKAIKSKPISLRPYVLFLSSFLPPNIYKSILSSKKP